jgi:hypothetical protein
MLLLRLLLLCACTRLYTAELSDHDVASPEATTDAFMNAPKGRPFRTPKMINAHMPLTHLVQGSSISTLLLQSIRESVINRKLPYFIPCVDPAEPCIDRDRRLPNKTVAVYAGRFYWGDFSRLRDLSLKKISKRVEGHCVTNFQEPVSRLIFCLKKNFNTEIKQKHNDLSEVSTQYLEKLLNSKSQLDGRSCLNEPYRVLSGQRDELFLESLLENDHARRAAFAMTLQHAKDCFPLVLEIPASFDLYNSIYLRANVFNSSDAALYRSLILKDLRKYSKEQLDLLQRYSYAESLVYHAVFKRTENILNNVLV